MYCVPLDAPCLRYLQVPGPGMYYAPSAVSAQKDSSKHSYASWGFGTSTRADQVPWPILTGLYLLRNQLPKTLPTWMIRANQDLYLRKMHLLTHARTNTVSSPLLYRHSRDLRLTRTAYTLY
jgi:hypothetical protein